MVPTLNCEGGIKDRLRKRHLSRPNTGRPIRQASKGITYQDVTLSEDTTPKKAVRGSNMLSEPSKERIAARGKKSIPPTKSHASTIKKQLKAETIHHLIHLALLTTNRPPH